MILIGKAVLFVAVDEFGVGADELRLKQMKLRSR
jgi:hypothetical protein